MRALSQSINTVAVKVSEQVGRDKVVATAQRLGITSPIASHPALALGASEVTLLELTAAYAPFANGGDAVVPHGILEVRTRSGRSLYRRSGSSLGRVVDSRHLRDINAMLSDTLKSGTGRAARLGDRAVAGKTGTSQKYRDGWFVGYTADLVAGVWLGNDNDTPTKRVTGGQLPATLWKTFMQQASTGRPSRAFPTGQEVTSVSPNSVEAPDRQKDPNFKRFIDGLADILSEVSRKNAMSSTEPDEDLDKDNSD